MRGVYQVLSASLLALVLSGCDNSDTYVSGSGNGNSSPSANDLAQGTQLANAAAGGQSSGGAGLDQSWRGYLATDPASFQAALPTYMQPYAQTYVDAGQKYNIDPALLAAITEEESGTNGPSYAFSNRNNAMGISPNDGGPRNFNSIDDSINYAARIISNPDGAYANDYTIGQLWYTYSPPGANNDLNDTNKDWGPAVATFYSNLKAKADGGG
ncbi:MAG TPA: hypothetical protein VN857_03480 [Chthoniobacterales bacterium]|jgi:hypothetical protein|nr:hypothetical protein [Chthoniobacterales bacterium]